MEIVFSLWDMLYMYSYTHAWIKMLLLSILTQLLSWSAFTRISNPILYLVFGIHPFNFVPFEYRTMHFISFAWQFWWLFIFSFQLVGIPLPLALLLSLILWNCVHRTLIIPYMDFWDQWDVYLFLHSNATISLCTGYGQ